jgi:hypothetical protein
MLTWNAWHWRPQRSETFLFKTFRDAATKRVAQQALQISCRVRSASSSLNLQKCALFLTGWRAWNSRGIIHTATFSAPDSTRPFTVLLHKAPKALWYDKINHAPFYVTRSSFLWVRHAARMVGLRSVCIWNFTTETRIKKGIWEICRQTLRLHDELADLKCAMCRLSAHNEDHWLAAV